MKKVIFANLVVALMALALQAQNLSVDRILVVNEKPVNASIIQREGHFYVDVEVLALALGGTVVLQPNRIVISTESQPPVRPEPEPPQGLSKEFQRISILALGDMRQWVGVMDTVITSGYPPTSQWPPDYHESVDGDVMEAAAAASTDEDRKALRLLQSHYAQLAKWADNVVADRKTLHADRFVDPNALQNDKVLPKITKCGEFLSSMIVRGRFSDDASCH